MYRTDKIAILLATYNGEKYIEEQLNSLLAQTNREWIAYIHDDGSQDGTVDIINSYAQKYPEYFVKIEGQATGSAKTNFFYLMTQVEAPYVMCCDQDDIWLPDKIQLTLDAMHELENEVEGQKEVPLLVFTELRVVDNERKIIADKMSEVQLLNCNRTNSKDLMVQNYITGCTMMINKRLLQLTVNNDKTEGIHKVNLDNVIMHDWWCALIAAEYGRLKYVARPTILYRQHGNNSVGAKSVKSFKYVFGKMLKSDDILNALEMTRTQAREFGKVFCLDQKNIIRQYGELGNKKKLARLGFYLRNRISKTGVGRNIGFLIFG